MNVQSQNVLDGVNHNTIFMVWNFKENVEINDAFKNICKLVINLSHSANTRFPETKASIVMGIGFQAWNLLDLKKPLPKEFEEFQEIVGQKHTAVSTKGDLHFHIRGNYKSFCIDTATAITDALREVADCVEEIHGFKYWDGRSIIGFVDGTENPYGDNRAYFGIIGDEDKEYKGCSYLFVQKYMHDLNAWRSMPVSEQEKAIGRSKYEDIEMSDEVKPTNSHSALANIGDDAKIVRDNMPFGNISTNDMGTYFICYASKFSTVKKMLTKMFVGEPVGNSDRLLDFSFPKTGTLFFVPTFDMLDEFSN